MSKLTPEEEGGEALIVELNPGNRQEPEVLSFPISVGYDVRRLNKCPGGGLAMNRERIGRGDEARKWRSVAAVSALLALSTLSACTAESTMQSAQSETTAQSANTATSAPAKPAVAAPQAETPEKEEIERVPLRDWKGLEMLDNLPEDRGESINKIREFIMLNDPECDLTAERIAASTTWGNFTDTGEQLMKALNVVGSLYSDYTVKGNEKKADLLIDGMTSYHSPGANKELKDLIHNTFFAAEFIDKHQPEAFNQRFNGAEITQNTDTLTAMFAEDGEPYQGYTISAKLQLAHKDLGVGEKDKEPVLHISLNVGGVITKFEVE